MRGKCGNNVKQSKIYITNNNQILKNDHGGLWIRGVAFSKSKWLDIINAYINSHHQKSTLIDYNFCAYEPKPIIRYSK